MMNLAARCHPIRLLLLDVDGVLTDGSIVIDDQGRELKRFHVRDGAALKFWRDCGHDVGIVSGRRAPAVDARAKELGIATVHQGINQKLPLVESLLLERKLSMRELCFIGDDLADLPVVRQAGLGIAVADAAAELRAVASYITSERGGHGAVREAIEMLLKAQGKWEGVLAKF